MSEEVIEDKVEEVIEDQVEAPQPKKYFYTCRKCRFIVFTDEDLVPHEVSVHKFSHYKSRDSNSAQSTCTSYFVENKPWMGELDDVSGRIDCPKCKGVLGKWKWDGTQCSCGYVNSISLSFNFEIVV